MVRVVFARVGGVVVYLHNVIVMTGVLATRSQLVDLVVAIMVVL